MFERQGKLRRQRGGPEPDRRARASQIRDLLCGPVYQVWTRKWRLKYTVGYGLTHVGRGLYFGPKTIFISPAPSENYIFPPPPTRHFSTPIVAFCALILPYFSFIFSPFFLFLLYFLPFSLRLFIFFPQMTSADIPPPPGVGVGIFQYIGPCM
jgi:hypothetical protein